MSAKVFYHKTPCGRPALGHIPTEIWIRIIEQAAESGLGLYDYNMTSSKAFDFIRTVERQEVKARRASLSIRSRMARVNKAWYSMAHPFLFEYIHLGRAQGVSWLYEALLLSGQLAASSSQGCALGWWTKRLDIDLRDDDHGDALITEHLKQIAGILTCLPRLQILTFSITGHGYMRHKSSRILNSVSCPESLKAIIWYTNCLWPGLASWTTFLERHEQLEVIRGPFTVDIKNHVRLHALKLVHPLLYYLLMSSDDSMDLTNVGLPSVRWVDYEVGSLPRTLNIFERLGNQLTVIQLTYPTEILLPMIAENDFGPVFEQLRSSCPNLEQLNVVLRTWPTFIQSLAMVLTAPESLRILGIHIQRSQISNFGLKRLLQDVLPLVLSKHPNLKIVRLLDKTSEHFHLHTRILVDGLKRLEGLGVTVQDHNNRVLAQARDFHGQLP